MYKIIFADDEPIERAAFRIFIKNNFNNIEVIGEGASGFEAIKLAREKDPDIVVMDICMPGIGGLTAIREIKRNKPKIKFVILSAYSKFDYAQNALKLGVEDYILKPVKNQKMYEVIQSIITKIEAEKIREEESNILKHKVENIQPYIEDEFVMTVISGANDANYFDDMLKFLDMNSYKWYCLTAAGNSTGISELLFEKIQETVERVSGKVIGANIGGNGILFIPIKVLKDNQKLHTNSLELANYIQIKLKTEYSGEFYLGIGKAYDGYENLRISYIEALDACKYAVKHKKPFYHVSDIKDMRDVGDSDDKKQLVSMNDVGLNLFDNICTGDFDVSTRTMNEFLNELRTIYGSQLSPIRDRIYQLTLIIENNVYGTFGKHFKKKLIQDTKSETINEIKDFKSLKMWLMLYLRNLTEFINDIKLSKSSSNLVINALDYINKNYKDNFTLEDVADTLSVSPFYLSKLIKEITGKNFTDHLTDKRINHAKELLLNTDMTIKEITYEVGFNSQSYFSTIFKKIVGVTPSDYKV